MLKRRAKVILALMWRSLRRKAKALAQWYQAKDINPRRVRIILAWRTRRLRRRVRNWFRDLDIHPWLIVFSTIVIAALVTGIILIILAVQKGGLKVSRPNFDWHVLILPVAIVLGIVALTAVVNWFRNRPKKAEPEVAQPKYVAPRDHWRPAKWMLQLTGLAGFALLGWNVLGFFNRWDLGLWPLVMILDWSLFWFLYWRNWYGIDTSNRSTTWAPPFSTIAAPVILLIAVAVASVWAIQWFTMKHHAHLAVQPIAFSEMAKAGIGPAGTQRAVGRYYDQQVKQPSITANNDETWTAKCNPDLGPTDLSLVIRGGQTVVYSFPDTDYVRDGQVISVFGLSDGQRRVTPLDRSQDQRKAMNYPDPTAPIGSVLFQLGEDTQLHPVADLHNRLHLPRGSPPQKVSFFLNLPQTEAERTSLTGTFSIRYGLK